MRVRVIFSKTDHMRYTSHLDLHRTWERTLRRARLPLAYSQGFNPRPKINLAAALPLGFTSECEIVEFWLDDSTQLTEIESTLREAAPPGIMVQTIEEVEAKKPKIPNLVDSADYMIILLDSTPNIDLRVSEILSSDSLPRERRGKPYDLRPLIEYIRVIPPIDGNRGLEMRLAIRAGATGRPEEIIREMGIDPTSTRIHRKSINLKLDC